MALIRGIIELLGENEFKVHITSLITGFKGFYICITRA